MALIDLWRSSADQIATKYLHQIIAFAGNGKLTDGGAASAEFRAFLNEVPSAFLQRYASECLSEAFSGSGLALQDVVNEIGTRIGFDVTAGRYRGVSGEIGFDGLWASSDGHSLVVEVKTTDTYRIDLNTLAGYRRALTKIGTITEEHSSILMIVGRDDTGDLGADPGIASRLGRSDYQRRSLAAPASGPEGSGRPADPDTNSCGPATPRVHAPRRDRRHLVFDGGGYQTG